MSDPRIRAGSDIYSTHYPVGFSRPADHTALKKENTSSRSPLRAEEGATVTLFLSAESENGFPESDFPRTAALALASAESVVLVLRMASSCFSSVRLGEQGADAQRYFHIPYPSGCQTDTINK